jgi:hypothetical protein
VVWLLVHVAWPPLGRRLVTGVLAADVVVAAGVTTTRAANDILEEGAEVAEVVLQVQEQISEGAKIVARKPHVAFYASGRRSIWLSIDRLAGGTRFAGRL